jgi:hypothetical protein
MAKATARPKARKGKPDKVTAAAALERARLKRMIQAKRDIARLAKELERAMIRAYDATQLLATNILEGRGYDVRPRMAAHEIGGPADDAGEK